MEDLYNIVSKPTRDNKRKLVRAYQYRDVIVPRGFETNGEDSPRWAWILGFPPFKPKYEPAYMVHDYMISVANTWQDIEKANEYWAEIMICIEDTARTSIAIKCMNAYWSMRKLCHV